MANLFVSSSLRAMAAFESNLNCAVVVPSSVLPQMLISVYRFCRKHIDQQQRPSFCVFLA